MRLIEPFVATAPRPRKIFVRVSTYSDSTASGCKRFPIFFFFFFSLSFTIMIIMMSEKGEFVVDPFTTGLIGWSVHIAIMSWVSVEQDAQLSIYSSLSLIPRYHIRWEFCGKVSPSSLKERLAWACQWFFDVPSPSEVGGKKAPGTDNNRKKKKKYNTYNSYI